MRRPWKKLVGSYPFILLALGLFYMLMPYRWQAVKDSWIWIRAFLHCVISGG